MVAALVLASAVAATADFTRYQVILDRMPFGAEAVPGPEPGKGPDGRPLPPPESFTKTLKMCAVTRNALTGRLQVGLVDTATKKNYFIAVGESEDGITVVDADYDNEKALLSKGEEQVWMTMSDVTTMAAVTPPAGGPGRPALPAMAVPPPMAPASGPAAAPLGRPDLQVRHRDFTAGVTNRLSGDALKKHLEQYQMDLIRAGGAKGPPLPMQLTPEMDQQLVKEGVLPAQ